MTMAFPTLFPTGAAELRTYAALAGADLGILKGGGTYIVCRAV